MLPMNPVAQRKTGKTVREITKVAEQLSQDQQQTLLLFAQFLLSQTASVAAEPEPFPEPKPIPRPAEESVIKAMRRLSASYFMLERGTLLNETSALMAQHVMQGRPAADVIDELEALFAAQYQRQREAS